MQDQQDGVSGVSSVPSSRPRRCGLLRNVRPDQLRAWAKQVRRDGGDAGAAAPVESLEQENRRLRREVAVLRQEQAFAKKVAADSTGRRDTFGKYSGRRAKAERLPRPCVELECNAIEIALRIAG